MFKKTELPNGIRVVSEFHPHSRSVAMGIWVLSGTRDETPDVAGVSHFLEHLVFKGTKNRSAFQIAKSLEEVGGELNAYTTREHTVYHALVLKDHWRTSLDVLADLVSHMRMRKSDFETERSVILQEIGMTDDDLEDLAYDCFFEQLFPKHPLGRPILGNLRSIGQMKMQDVLDSYKESYSADRLIVAAAGCVDHQELVESVQKLLGHKKNNRRFHARRLKNRSRPVPQVFRRCLEKKSEQLHLLMGFPVGSMRDKNRFEAYIINALLGGGMTSRIYQSVREKKGLVYSVYSMLNTFHDFGCINIYAACENSNMKDVHRTILREINRLKNGKLKESEVELYKTQVKGAILLGADDMENRMSSIGVNEMVFGEYRPVESIIAEIDKVTVKSVREFVRKYVDVSKTSVLVMGDGAKDLQQELEEVVL